MSALAEHEMVRRCAACGDLVVGDRHDCPSCGRPALRRLSKREAGVWRSLEGEPWQRQAVIVRCSLGRRRVRPPGASVGMPAIGGRAET